MTILVAEDDPAILRLMIRVLTGAGIQVGAASSGVDLLKAWHSLRCRVILSDVSMPGPMDGIDGCLAIRSYDPTVRIFMMTSDPYSRQRAEQNGFKVALMKPFLIEDILRWAGSLDMLTKR